MKNREFTIFIFIASVIVGLLISMNINFDGTETTKVLNAKEYQDAYNKRNSLYNEISKLKENNRELQKKINNYSKSDESSIKVSNDMVEELNNNLMIAGLSDVKGSGLKIVLEDGGEAFNGEVVDDFMRLLRTIHDDDMIKVINELKAAGAEAISINNQRIIYNTEIYCGGQFLRMNGVKIPAPFYVNVIGDPEKIENQIMRDGSYIKTLMNRGIKVQITKSDDITMPAYISDMNPKYMKSSGK
ncbi:DUF881 domain-containing protein [Clostridium sp. LIBA-8841]|uniref:DUF881 domain-containing protein n=1 Tax=Clostridium sp. LIBA-8841 TaxID=2987530 RepID=UPI002AC7559D|nr:DUF881 domain-containing protein [Clostridium sp. LIBA-8841]MDZ5252799.1 DUF881 domain-containing protein [Clostridium sp. LIBA-8841]